VPRAKHAGGRPAEFAKRTTLVLSWDEKSKERLETIAKREGKSLGELFRDITLPTVTDYIQNHIAGNAQYTLDHSLRDPTFIALPSMGEVITVDKIKDIPDDTLTAIVLKAKARTEEAQAELKRRGWSTWDINALLEGRKPSS